MSAISTKKDRIYYGWIIVAVCLIVSTILVGLRFSYGVFFKSIEADFGINRLETSSVYSVAMLLSAAVAIVVGWALDRYGPRFVFCGMGIFAGLGLLVASQTHALWQLYFAYSFLLSVGIAGIMPVVLAVVSRWFTRERGLALGISTSGSGTGSLLISPFAAYLIVQLGWRAAFVTLGLISLVVIIGLGLLMRRAPGELERPAARPESSAARSQPEGLSLKQAVRTLSFWLMMFVFLFFATCISMVMTHLVPYATDVGVSTIEASTVISVMGAIQIGARLSVGRISDFTGRKIPAIVCAVLGTVALAWLIGSRELWMFYLFAVIFALSWGGLGVACLSLVGDTFGGRNLGVIMGTLEVGFSAGSAVGAALAGFLFDATGSYLSAFIVGAAVMLLAALLVAFTRREHQNM